MIEKSPNSEIHQPASSAKLFEVEIAGVPLRLKSLHDVKTVNELVSMVDRKVKDALPLTKTGSIQNAAILASLHLAEEYLLLRRKAKAELERLEAKTLKLILELESSRVTGLQGKDDRDKIGAASTANESRRAGVQSEDADVTLPSS